MRKYVNCQASHFNTIIVIEPGEERGGRKKRGEKENKGWVRNWGERGQGGSEEGEGGRAITQLY